MVTNTGEVTYTAASDKDDGVLLQVVSDAGDIGGCLDTVGQTDSGDLTKCRVRLLRGSRGNLGAYASFLRVALVRHRVGQRVKSVLENRRLGLILLIAAALSDELVKSWHFLLFLLLQKFNVYIQSPGACRCDTAAKKASVATQIRIIITPDEQFVKCLLNFFLPLEKFFSVELFPMNASGIREAFIFAQKPILLTIKDTGVTFPMVESNDISPSLQAHPKEIRGKPLARSFPLILFRLH